MRTELHLLCYSPDLESILGWIKSKTMDIVRKSFVFCLPVEGDFVPLTNGEEWLVLLGPVKRGNKI